MLLKSNGKVFENVSIDNQASQNNFYGDVGVEKKVTEFDTKYSKTLHKVINEVRTKNFTEDCIVELVEAICFQRLRTLSERQSQEPLMDFYKDFFEPQVNDKSYDSGISEEATDAVNKVMGQVFNDLCDGKKHQVYEMFNLEKEYTEICDLNITFLNNVSDVPFVFSDTPVVRFNNALKDFQCSKIENKSAGLVIYYPLNSLCAFLMFDNEVYKLQSKNLNEVTISNKSDVDSLNKLQIHEAINSVYFKDFKYKDYVYDLWENEKINFRSMKSKVADAEEITLDGYKTGRKVLCFVKDEPTYCPELTFLKVKDIQSDDPLIFRNRFISINPEYIDSSKCERIDMTIDRKGS
jgi:hypothetical protein